MRELALFAGAGGGLLASTHLLGWDTVCGVEIDEYCRSVLMQRQRDGMLPFFPLWDDIRTFDGTIWRGSVDVVSGGFPCQDISSAGRGAGLSGARSGLWFEMLRVIGEVRPAYVFAENSPMLRTRGLERVLQGLAELGYDAAWGVLGAWHAGAPHRRNRMWIVAANPDRCRERGFAFNAQVAGASQAIGGRSHAANTDGAAVRIQQGRRRGAQGQGAPESRDVVWWSEPRYAGVDDGVASRVERIRATGNGQVPAVAALAWRVLSEQL